MATVYKRSKDRKQKNSKWIISWYDAERAKWRDKTGYVDKRASMEMGERLERGAALRAEGLVDPMDEHRRTDINVHLAEFVAGLTAEGRSPRYVLQVENRIRRIIEGTGAKRMHELDPVRINRFLSGLRIKERQLSGYTRNEYVGTVRAFTMWAVQARRIKVDPLASLRRTERKAIRVAHPRRALTMAEMARLLDAAQRRPLLDLQTVRTGPNAGMPVGNVRDHIARRAERMGRERRLAYLIALWTGLRRSEIQALTWGDVDLDSLPARIRLRAETTKSRRADTLVIHPQLADELRACREQGPAGDPVVSSVPSMKVLRSDLKLAGIEYGDQASGYVDFHAIRKTLSTMMARAGMSQRVRQAHMRHTDPRLTDVTYMDEALLPVADELLRLPGVPETAAEQEGAAAVLRATGTTGN